MLCHVNRIAGGKEDASQNAFYSSSPLDLTRRLNKQPRDCCRFNISNGRYVVWNTLALCCVTFPCGKCIPSRAQLSPRQQSRTNESRLILGEALLVITELMLQPEGEHLTQQVAFFLKVCRPVRAVGGSSSIPRKKKKKRKTNN